MHQACQDLRLKESSMCLVGGTNLVIGPDTMIPMSKFRFVLEIKSTASLIAHLVSVLNPDGKCYPFDSRGAGYGRG